jgi:hypothetical protein
MFRRSAQSQHRKLHQIVFDPAALTLNQWCLQLVARLGAVRGALQDHLEDNSIVYHGVPALLNFIAEICHGLKSRILGAGSGPLQELLVKARVCCKSSLDTIVFSTCIPNAFG